jgi:FkbM family methyltransferase
MRIAPKHWIRRWRSPWLGEFYRAFRRWRADGTEPRRREFPHLTRDSLVLDFDGFEGAWTAEIHDRYGAVIHVFEPHPDFAASLERRFAGNDRVIVHPFALGSGAGTLALGDDADASSALRGAGTVLGEVREVADFFATFPPGPIAPAKINIEGGEYDPLPALIDPDVLPRFEVLQVQFHLFAGEMIEARQALVARIERTHAPDWSYPFVWEQWTRRPA